MSDSVQADLWIGFQIDDAMQIIFQIMQAIVN
jgi:hypothetical protein